MNCERCEKQNLDTLLTEIDCDGVPEMWCDACIEDARKFAEAK